MKCVLCNEEIKDGEPYIIFGGDLEIKLGKFYNKRLILFKQGDVAHAYHWKIIGGEVFNARIAQS